MITSTTTKKRLCCVVLALSMLAAACSSESTSTADSGETSTTSTSTTSATTDTTDASSASTSTATSSEYLGSYTLMDEEYGTMVTVSVDGTTRTIEANALPDHDTGEFPNDGNPNTISEQDASYSFTTEPTFTGNATDAMTPGVAINGVKFEPGTAETVSCESGPTLRVEALQDLYDLGLDFNNAHVQPTGEYHYHGVSDLLVDAHESGDDLVHVGFAADGYLMYYSLEDSYASSYELSTAPRTGTDCVASGAAGGVSVEIDGTTPDGTYSSDWVFNAEVGDLDSCNGIEIDGVYAYLITDTYPYVSRCLNGEATATGPGGAGAGQDGSAAGVPDFEEAAATLGITEAELLEALGDLPPDLDAAAEALGITVDELIAVLPAPPQ